MSKEQTPCMRTEENGDDIYTIEVRVPAELKKGFARYFAEASMYDEAGAISSPAHSMQEVANWDIIPKLAYLAQFTDEQWEERVSMIKAKMKEQNPEMYARAQAEAELKKMGLI